jgi:ATPase family protein associated with various cellular activities (AAA)
VPTFPRRPSLPSGHALPGFPGVEKAVHVDSAVEVYLLADASERILVHVRAEFEPRATASSRLLSWWEALGNERVVVESVLPTSGALQAILHVKGEWLGTEKKRGAMPAEEPELLALLGALCDVGVIALTLRAEPSLAPALVWWDKSDGGRVSPVYVGQAAVEEERLVQSAARLVYEHASGIVLPGAKGTIVPLSKWAKTAGPQISVVLDRCLSTGSERLRTLAEVKQNVERGSIGAGKRGGTGLSAASRLGKGLSAVAGMRELRALLEKEVVAPIRDPEPFKKYGLSIPNGILLYGPPGCGKTWIARKLAEEVGHFFVELIPSEVASPYIHDSVLRIREIFDLAAERAPSIVFIDEFEALAPSRADLGGFQQYKSEEVNELLAHLNASAEKKVFVIAATNEPQKIDPAMRRTGRLDKLIYVGPPDAEARAEMLRMHLAGRPVVANLDYAGIAATLEGYSASDIKFLVDQAARAAIEVRAEISGETVLVARARVPPSVTAEDEARYKGFVTRG